jgi:hypothetical protein
MENSRRGFLGKVAGSVGAAFVMLKTDRGEVKAVSDPSSISTVDVPSGQIVDDIIIGCFGLPQDANYMIEFYREKSPQITQLQVPLNARATFRWVPAPGREIRLQPGERLLWKIAYADGSEPKSYRVVVHTRGMCLHTQRIVINQTEFC